MIQSSCCSNQGLKTWSSAGKKCLGMYLIKFLSQHHRFSLLPGRQMPGIETPVGKTEEFRASGEYPLHLTESKALSVGYPGQSVHACVRASPPSGKAGKAPKAKLASSRTAKCNQSLHSGEGCCDRGGGIWSESLSGTHVSHLDMLGTSDLSCAPDRSVVNQIVQSSASELALSEQIRCPQSYHVVEISQV